MSSKIKIRYRPLPKQSLAHKSSAKKVAYLGGYGAGKTFWLIHHMFKLANANPGVAGGLLCPTLKMAKRDVIPTFKDVCSRNRIHHDWNKSESYIYLPQSRSTIYLFHGEDDGDSIRGPNLGWMLMNEVTLLSENTYNAAIARVRDKRAPLRQIAMCGTFEEFGGVYEKLNEDPTCEIITSSTRENVHVADDYVKLLENTYDEEMQKQYIDGLPVIRLGRVAARCFRRDRHVNSRAERIPGAPVWVSLDFNVDPMGAVLWNRIQGNDSTIKLRAFDEICLRGADTYDVAKVITDRVGTEITIFPDPAGNARSTRGIAKTDMQILRDANFKDIRFKRSIRSVKDCMNAVNGLFSNNEVEIHPRCKEFIKDLEQVKIKESGYEFDKTDSKRTHWLDGFKDMIDYEFPVIKPVQSSSRQW